MEALMDMIFCPAETWLISSSILRRIVLLLLMEKSILMFTSLSIRVFRPPPPMARIENPRLLIRYPSPTTSSLLFTSVTWLLAKLRLRFRAFLYSTFVDKLLCQVISIPNKGANCSVIVICPISYWGM